MFWVWHRPCNPEDPYARINSSAYNIELGLFDQAIDNLKSISAAEALNNIGVAFARKGEYDRAADYLQRAIDAGSADAAYNLGQLKQVVE